MGYSGSTATRRLDSGVQVVTAHAPISLTPTPFPRSLYDLALRVQTDMASLMYIVSRDRSFLVTTLAQASAHDPFTAQLVQLMRQVETAKGSPAAMQDPVDVMLTRSDYMIDEPTDNLLQVEINMIAASFGALSAKATDLHRYLLGYHPGLGLDPDRVPLNNSLTGLADGLGRAAEIYADFKDRGTTSTSRAGGETDALDASSSTTRYRDNGVILMVVQPGEMNAFDQQWLATTIWSRFGRRVVRKSLAEIDQSVTKDDTGTLWLREPAMPSSTSTPPSPSTTTSESTPILTVYYRAGYTPTDYPDAVCWRGREKLEMGDTPKCPSLAMQLAGTKRIQQELARPGIVERFLSPGSSSSSFSNEESVVDRPEEEDGNRGYDEDGLEAVVRVRKVFAGQWALDDHSTRAETVRMALADPDAYVLKPQREGGGNNLYGEDLARTLREGGENLAQYILMTRIRPPIHRTLFCRNGEATWADSLSELGVYGALVAEGGVVTENVACGHLLRTKIASSNEGGVAAGYAVLDSPYLMD